MLDRCHCAQTNSNSQWRSTLSLSSLTALCFFLRTDLYELEKEPSYWDAQARMTLNAALKLRPREHRAKNLILFLGDGEIFLHPKCIYLTLAVGF